MGRRGTVFGLDVSSAIELPFLFEDGAEPTGRTLELRLADQPPEWPGPAAIVCDQREPDESVSFRIESQPGRGYLIWGPRYGRHFLSPDGRLSVTVPGQDARDCWRRMLIAQVLPFAAALQGLEVFHASAVATPLGAVALLGPSGVGKTSLAVELCRQGEEFLADDVLALERAGDALLAHPGTPAAGIPRPPTNVSSPPGREPCTGPIGELLSVDERERLVRIRRRGRARALAAMFLLEPRREPQGQADGAARFLPLPDARALLASTFNSVLLDGERLARLLDVCALAARCRVERVIPDPRGTPSELAHAITRRLGIAR